jgi:transposase-like protein/predicted phosphodiesterase
MPMPKISDEVLASTVKHFVDANYSVKEAAKLAGINYNTYTSRLRVARERGLVAEGAIVPATESMPAQEVKVVVKPTYRIQQRKSKPDETKRVLAIGDCHDGPRLPDKRRFFAMGRYAKEREINEIIQIGDFATCDSLNRFDRNDTVKGQEKPTFKQDMISFQCAVRAFHQGLGGADIKRHVTLGNHEDRIWSFTNRNPEVVEMLDQLLFATLDDYGWTYSPYGEFYYIGDVGFTHAPMNMMGKPYGGMHAENQISRDALHDIVFGHTHKRLDKTFPKIGGKITVMNLGCSLPEGHVEEYAKHSITGWSYGVYEIGIKDGIINERTWVPMNKLIEEYGGEYAGDQ